MGIWHKVAYSHSIITRRSINFILKNVIGKRKEFRKTPAVQVWESLGLCLSLCPLDLWYGGNFELKILKICISDWNLTEHSWENDRPSFKIQMRTHMGEMSYKCSQCNYTCTRVTNLHTHMLTHTEVRAFNCDQCIEYSHEKVIS